MKIVPGPASSELGLKIGSLLGARVISMDYKRFADGELYIRFTEDIDDEDVIIIQTTGPPQDSNLLHLLFLIDAARDLGAKSITAVVPYVAYGRQDARYRSGEAISSNTVFKLIKNIGVDVFITVDFHKHQLLEDFGKHFKNISAMPFLANYMRKHNLSGAFSLAPDDGALEFVKVTSEILKGSYGWLEKTRNKITGKVAFKVDSLDVNNKDAIIFDDIISTGSTMAYAVKALKDKGARRVYAACVHPLLIGDAREKILQEGAFEIIGTDSVQSPVSIVSIAPLIVEALKK
jgi:ribose-phosphate pyrophosphokinase